MFPWKRLPFLDGGAFDFVSRQAIYLNSATIFCSRLLSRSNEAELEFQSDGSYGAAK
jgi:hypothetical protein